MDRVTLAVYMWVNLEEAVHDMPPGPVSELFERFIHWTHQLAAPARVDVDAIYVDAIYINRTGGRGDV